MQRVGERRITIFAIAIAKVETVFLKKKAVTDLVMELSLHFF